MMTNVSLRNLNFKNFLQMHYSNFTIKELAIVDLVQYVVTQDCVHSISLAAGQTPLNLTKSVSPLFPITLLSCTLPIIDCSENPTGRGLSGARGS